jgi:long-chain fatty acid transport protein
MRKTIKLAVVAALALGTTSAFATNGDVMIGQGAKSRSMGGVGIAKSFGAESGLANPAMIASVEKSEATLVVTAFAPSVAFSSNAMANTMVAPGTQVNVQSADSAANFSVIPEIAYATRLNSNTVIGLSVSGTAGMGTDYDATAFGTATDNGSFRMKTNLALLKVAVPVSYQIDGFTMGMAGILQYGTLQMTHMVNNGTGMVLRNDDIGADVGYGVEFGASYDMKNIGAKGLTLAAVYKSKIGMTYKNTISTSVTAFGGAAMTGVNSGDNLDQPEERGVGMSYEMSGNTISFDYKNIAWGDAAGYKDFGWENQDVYAVGYEYADKSFAVRLGYNYAKKSYS